MVQEPQDATRTLYLIDGHAQIFRAYYAIRSGMVSAVTGEPTNAVFAFVGMLLKLFDKFHPHYVVMAVDSPGPTFREELYQDYKANRDQAPQELAAQFDRIYEVTRLFGIPVLGLPGAEADDIIATITQRVLDDPACRGVRVRIVSKDKDLEQLLGDRVTMFDIHTDTTIDTARLMAEKGIRPDQVVDMLTLTGDSVDNIPGVPGVGPKTATKLIREYQSLDGVLAHLGSIKGKVGQNIAKSGSFLPIGRRLVTLDRGVDIPFDLADAHVGGIDATRLRALFRELGLRRHLSELDRLLSDQPAGRPPKTIADLVLTLPPPESPAPLDHPATLFDAGNIAAPVPTSPDAAHPPMRTAADGDYHAVTTRRDLDELVRTLKSQPMISVDTETVGLGSRVPLCGLSFAWKPGHGVYVPVRSPQPDEHLGPETVLEVLRPVLENADLPKCGHNIKYDLLVLRHAGVNIRGVAFDSMIASHLVGELAHGLDHLAQTLLGHEMIPISQLIGPRQRGQQQRTMDQVPLDQVVPYAAEDADIALRLYDLFRDRLRAMGLDRLATTVEMPLVAVLADMEYQGICVDPGVLAEQKQQLAGRIADLRRDIQSSAGCDFNVDSPKQLAQVLFSHLGLPVVKKTKTGPSTDIEVLEALCDKPDLTEQQTAVPRMVVEYRQLTKLVNTYLDSLSRSIDPHTGRVHAKFHQTGAATGRLSSSDPNLQNIPVRTELGRQVRRAFIAGPATDPQVLISADYSQIELRILAHLSEDPALIEAFEQDLDIHAAVAAQVFGVEPASVTKEQRAHAKMINFGIIYGVSAYGLARRVDNLDLSGARDLISGYRQRFAGIDAFLTRCVQQAADLGYVTTILDRRRPIPQVRSSNAAARSLGERLAINTVVQGSAADLIKLAMVDLHQRIEQQGLPMKLLLQIHDELVLEAPAADAQRLAGVVRDIMEGAMSLKVPLKVQVGIGRDWLNAK